MLLFSSNTRRRGAGLLKLVKRRCGQSPPDPRARPQVRNLPFLVDLAVSQSVTGRPSAPARGSTPAPQARRARPPRQRGSAARPPLRAPPRVRAREVPASASPGEAQAHVAGISRAVALSQSSEWQTLDTSPSTHDVRLAHAMPHTRCHSRARVRKALSRARARFQERKTRLGGPCRSAQPNTLALKLDL